MPRVQNPTQEERVIPGYPAFAPGEVREVSEDAAAYLTNGSGIVLVSEDVAEADPAPKKRKPSLPDNA